MNKKPKGFSKKLLIADYAVTIVLIIGFFICSILNGIYATDTMNKMIEIGMDVTSVVIAPPFNLDGFGVFFSTWIAQLGVSSYAYYSMTKSEHRIELPVKLLEELPNDLKEQINVTEIITTVLTNSNN